MRCLRLPFTFDPERLRADLAQVRDSEWIPHMQRRHYDGQWSGAPLRGLGGNADNIVPEAHNGAEFQDTPLLRRCPYFREVLAHFRCPQQAVRLLRLHPGSTIAEHVDHALDFEDGEIRIHIPVITSDAVQFFLDGARLVMAPGECWYTNVNLPHSVENQGTTDRIHLVIDCRVDDWLRDVFARTARPNSEHYAARLTLSSPPEPEKLMTVFNELAGAGAKFNVDRDTLILTWREKHSWQLRLRPLAAPAETKWSAQIESSPDPEKRHRNDYRAFLDRCVRAFPTLTITQEGMA